MTISSSKRQANQQQYQNEGEVNVGVDVCNSSENKVVAMNDIGCTLHKSSHASPTSKWDSSRDAHESSSFRSLDKTRISLSAVNEQRRSPNSTRSGITNRSVVSGGTEGSTKENSHHVKSNFGREGNTCSNSKEKVDGAGILLQEFHEDTLDVLAIESSDVNLGSTSAKGNTSISVVFGQSASNLKKSSSKRTLNRNRSKEMLETRPSSGLGGVASAALISPAQAPKSDKVESRGISDTLLASRLSTSALAAHNVHENLKGLAKKLVSSNGEADRVVSMAAAGIVSDDVAILDLVGSQQGSCSAVKKKPTPAAVRLAGDMEEHRRNGSINGRSEELERQARSFEDDKGTGVTHAKTKLAKNPRDRVLASPKRRSQTVAAAKKHQSLAIPYLSTSHQDDALSIISKQSSKSSINGLSLIDTPLSQASYHPYNTNQQQHLNYPYGLNSSSQSVSSRSTSRSISSEAALPAQPMLPSSFMSSDPDQEEQAMFEQRLCEDEYGVAVRKINSNGKSQLRYVKCITLHNRDEDSSYGAWENMSRSVPVDLTTDRKSAQASANRSVSSLMGRITNRKTAGGAGGSVSSKNSKSNAPTPSSSKPNPKRALMWGNKKKVKVSLDKFTSVRKGKTTDRTRKNPCPASRLLSIVTNEKHNSSLDIEAPTRLDRDKFAKAFARFLNIPLEEQIEFRNANGSNRRLVDASATVDFGANNHVEESKQRKDNRRERISAAHSAPCATGGATNLERSDSRRTSSTAATPQGDVNWGVIGALLPAIEPSPTNTADDELLAFKGTAQGQHQSALDGKNTKAIVASRSNASNSSNLEGFSAAALKRVTDGAKATNNTQGPLEAKRTTSTTKQLTNVATSQVVASSQAILNLPNLNDFNNPEQGSQVSSLTQGFDQEIVEELHQALNELRAELEASRAEAARAVKVAEQAIQSAESCSSNDWNSTVTHKAAEAAAQAQKRSAEAMARQRLAEEKLAGEKKSAAFWRRQAEVAEEDAGALQTRAAAAEVQRAAMAEEVEREKLKAATYIQSLKRDFSISEKIQRETLLSAAERNRLLEIELDGTRRDLIAKGEESKTLQDALVEFKTSAIDGSRNGNKKKFFGNRTKRIPRGPMLLDSQSSSVTASYEMINSQSDSRNGETFLKLYAEAAVMRKQFELLRRTAIDELRGLPSAAQEWANQAARALALSQSEVTGLRERLALESATRRKLLNEVQDLRGSVRVYCRPRPLRLQSAPAKPGNAQTGIISVPTHEICLLHREKISGESNVSSSSSSPMSFEFDRVFAPDSSQKEIYSEMEELVLSTLDGYNVCLMAYGQTGSGKTHSMIGDFQVKVGDDKSSHPKVELLSEGMHLLAVRQLFAIAQHRSARYQDSFTLTIVEVHNEKLRDLVAGTDIAQQRGQVLKNCNRRNRGHTEEDIDLANSQVEGENSSKGSKLNKLEIRTNYDGDTIVQGLVSISVKTLEDVKKVWDDSLTQRAVRLLEQGIEQSSYESSSHLIATLQIVSTNIATGIGTVGKIQFVDLAGSDLVARRSPNPLAAKPKSTPTDSLLAGVGNNLEWKYANKSLVTLADVVTARSQFARSVPYRNSTLTHLLRDSLEADTKVLLMVCVSSDQKDLQETACALRFALAIKKVVIGKATKHTVSLA